MFLLFFDSEPSHRLTSHRIVLRAGADAIMMKMKMRLVEVNE